MKLVYLSESRIPSREANAVHVMMMCAAMAELGHEVTLVAPEASNVEPGVADAYAFYGVPPSFEIRHAARPTMKGRGWVYGWNAASIARRGEFDAAFGRSLHACAMVAIGGVPTAWDVHMATFLGKWHERMIFRAMTSRRAFRGVMTNCQALADAILAEMPELRDRVVTAHNGANPVRADVRPMFAGGVGRLQVGYLGQLYPGKGVEVIRDLAQMAPWADFHIVGGDSEAVASLDAVGIANVEIHGFVPPSDVEGYAIACDVLLAPYQSSVMTAGGGETAAWMSPLKLFAYMAAGKPILCSDIPVLREIIVDGRNGVMLPPKDPVAWARALRRLADDPNERRRLGDAALVDFYAQHTWRQRAARAVGMLSRQL